MKRWVLGFGFLVLGFLIIPNTLHLKPTHAAEPTMTPADIVKEKQFLESQADRGRLMIENAQLRFRELVALEEKIKAEKQEQSANGKGLSK